jgi:hypothetical protein
MKRTLFGLALFAVVLLPGAARADELADLSAKQATLIYNPREEGLANYEATISCTKWPEGAKLRFELASFGLEGEGLPEESEESPLDDMIASFTDLMRRLEPLTRRADEVCEGYKIEIKAAEGTTVVTAVRGPGGEDDMPANVVTVLDENLLTKSLAEMYPGRGTCTCSDFVWRKEGAKWIAAKYVYAEGDAFSTWTVDHESVGGYLLPVRVSVWRGRAETVFTFAYRSVNGQPVAGIGLFGTPEATVRTFFAACAAKDGGLVGKCFAKCAAGEFKPLVENKATPEMLAELAAMFGAGRVTGVEMAEDGKSAAVAIAYARGGEEAEERLEMTLEDGEWKIVDF